MATGSDLAVATSGTIFRNLRDEFPSLLPGDVNHALMQLGIPPLTRIGIVRVYPSSVQPRVRHWIITHSRKFARQASRCGWTDAE